jgi:hypothetical protein
MRANFSSSLKAVKVAADSQLGQKRVENPPKGDGLGLLQLVELWEDGGTDAWRNYECQEVPRVVEQQA